MNNLEKASHFSSKFDENIIGEVKENSLVDNVCCFTTKLNNLCICENFGKIQCSQLDEKMKNKVTHLAYLSFWRVVFISTNKDMIIYEPNTDKFSVFHSLSTKIICTSWNLNETNLVVIDNENNLYGYTFEVNTALPQFKFTEANQSHLGDPVPNSVYVGWGSHNTQFKGAKKKDEEKVEELPQEYSSPKISWRSNGEQFVINYWADNRRFLKVFDSFLKPLYQSDIYPNLLSPTSFSFFIACAAKHNQNNKIVFFEKNCLVKSEFFIPENKGEIKDIQYHPDMNILAVYSEEPSYQGYLNIYLNSNAKWYLKQQLLYSSKNRLKSFHWATLLCKTICMLNVLTTDNIERSLFRVVINRYPQNQLVAVINGATVDFTKFSDQIVPPPLSSISLNFERPVNRIFFNLSLNIFYFLTSDCDINTYSYQNGEFTEYNSILDFPVFKFYNDFNDNDHIIYSIEKNINNFSYQLVLDHKQDLLINNSVVCSNVLSMFLHENYLLFTHASCKLYCIRLTLENINSSNWNLNKFYSREVEQGAEIVCVTRSSDIILQLPRGNLETVTCRLISIDIVEKLLDGNKWEEAVCLIRQQRLNWNLLIDLNPQRFSDHIKEFIEATKTISVLNTVVSEFSNEDCLQTMYSQCVESYKSFDDSDKTQVLLNILDNIILLNPVLNLVSIVTLQVKHFTLKSALKSVCTVFEAGEQDICKKAVFQILLHSHSKNVISESFTLYNIPFMSFIYSCCSEDPRLFEPELETLKGLDPIELRFKMNVLGKNYKRATKYLIRCLNYDEKYMTDFITKHITECVAYESISPKHPNFKLCSKLFAKYLALRARHDEAGLILERAELYKEALDEYKNSLNWYKVVNLLDQLDFEDSSKRDILLELANNLVNQKRVDDAVIIYEHYCGKYEIAIRVLSETKMFQKALSLAKKYNCTDAIENMIKPFIIKYRTDLFERISELGTKFSDYTTRLQTIRHKKLHNLKHKYAQITAENAENFENDDLYSEYGSIISKGSSLGSRSSKGSTLSSRNRRKQEKKKIDLREGGVYEDIALIRQLYLLAIDIFACGEDVKEICLTLTDDHSFKFCKLLHEKLNSTQNMIRANISKIWSDAFLNAQESSEPEILAVIQNRTELDFEYRTPPPFDKLIDNWKLLMFSNK